MIECEVHNEVGEKKKTYPWIGISKIYKHIVLFNGSGKGIVLHKGNDAYKVGEYISDWNEEFFSLLESEIILKNS